MSDQPSDTPQGRPLLDVPRITASTFGIQATGDEMLVLCNNAYPVVDSTTGMVTNAHATMTTAVLALSPGAAHDLAVLLTRMVAYHEQNVGPIHTRMGKGEPVLSFDKLHQLWPEGLA